MRTVAAANATRPPLPRPIAVLAVATIASLASYAFLALRADAPVAAPQAAVEPPGIAATSVGGVDLPRIGRAIDTWTANIERDPADFISAVNLATLYVERGHLTGSVDDLDAALASVDRALAIDGSLMAARLMRADVLLASHDFVAAETAAAAILAEEPDLPPALAVVGDARLELGDLAGAESAYDQIDQDGTAPMLARRARLASLTGSLDRARELASEALTLAEREPGSDLTFYHLLVGTLAFTAGDLHACLDASEAALAAEPGSPGAFVAIGRAQAALGDIDSAIGAYERAVEIHPDPASLAALGDLLVLAERPDDAEARYAQVRRLADDPREMRLWGRPIILYFADHNESPEAAVASAEAELVTRTDVWGWDAYAWALFSAGRFAEADEAMANARALGTEDARLDYHAGMIAAGLGRTDEARELLQRALDRNRAFDPLGAVRAAEVLATLEAAR